MSLKVKGNILALFYLNGDKSLEIYDIQKNYKKFFGPISDKELNVNLNELVQSGYLEKKIVIGHPTFWLSKRGREFVKKLDENI